MKQYKLITEQSYDIELYEGKDKNLYIVGVFSSADTKNANGRIYPKPLLEREVSKLMETSVKNRTALGELGHPKCFSKTAEILTKDGWKLLSEISNDEIVVTVKPENMEIEYHRINKKIEQKYTGEMFHFKSRNIDLTVTPTHRFLIEDRYGNRFFKTATELYQMRVENDPKLKKYKIPKTGNWVGNEVEKILIKGIDKEECRYYRKDFTQDLYIDAEKFSAFLGLYLAEGWLSEDKNHYNTINISQVNENNTIQIRNLLNSIHPELKWIERVNENGAGNPSRTFTLTDIRLAKILRPLGKSHEKYIPEEYKSLPANCLEEMFYWFCLGDGRHCVDKDGFERRDIFSTSERLIDDFNEILLKIGLCGEKRTETCEVDYKFADRMIKVENKKPLHFLKIITTKYIYLDTHIEITKEFYDDYVYCVNVTNNTFYVRDGEFGSCCWTGNSPETSLERAAILTESLEWKGNDVLGKARVLDTPHGNILKTLLKENVKIGISSRGLGTVNEDGIVNEDLKILCWDCVSSPSNYSSWVKGIYEGQTFTFPEENINTITEEDRQKALEYTYNKIVKFLDSLR